MISACALVVNDAASEVVADPHVITRSCTVVVYSKAVAVLVSVLVGVYGSSVEVVTVSTVVVVMPLTGASVVLTVVVTPLKSVVVVTPNVGVEVCTRTSTERTVVVGWGGMV